MEFDLNSLDRDWVEGISGQELLARVQCRAKSIQGQDQFIVIDRIDPHDFTVELFAAILVGRSIALANPNGAHGRGNNLIPLLGAVSRP